MSKPMIGRPENQREAVLQYIQIHGEIDFLAAANELRVSQLTGRIAELRKEGWEFDKRPEQGINRFGHSFVKVIYSNARKR